MEKNVAVPAVDAVQRDTTLIALAVSAIGIVFGDIGTSPLYTLKECFHQLSKSEGALARADVLGVLSLVFRRVSRTLRHPAWEFTDLLPLTVDLVGPVC